MDSFTLSTKVLDLVARMRIEQQEHGTGAGPAAPRDTLALAELRARFAEEALALCEAHFEGAAPTPAGQVAATAGFEGPEDGTLHLSVQEWTSGSTFAVCGRRLTRAAPVDFDAAGVACSECAGVQAPSFGQILTAEEAAVLSDPALRHRNS